MPLTKADQFKPKEIRLAEIAKALSHPARIALLKAIAKRSDCVCGELVELLPLAQATVSQHLKELKRVGLIKGEIDGPRSCYCINPDAVGEAQAMLGQFLGSVQACCIAVSSEK
jgi:DNA-binding transcriptional ArsR family regulator